MTFQPEGYRQHWFWILIKVLYFVHNILMLSIFFNFFLFHLTFKICVCWYSVSWGNSQGWQVAEGHGLGPLSWLAPLLWASGKSELWREHVAGTCPPGGGLKMKGDKGRGWGCFAPFKNPIGPTSKPQWHHRLGQNFPHMVLRIQRFGCGSLYPELFMSRLLIVGMGSRASHVLGRSIYPSPIFTFPFETVSLVCLGWPWTFSPTWDIDFQLVLLIIVKKICIVNI